MKTPFCQSMTIMFMSKHALKFEIKFHERSLEKGMLLCEPFDWLNDIV